jgi:hypothetical protein
MAESNNNMALSGAGSPILYEKDERMDFLETREMKKKESFSASYKETRRGRMRMWWNSYSIEFRELVMYLGFLLVYSTICFGPAGTTIDRYQFKADLQANVHTDFQSTVTTTAAWYSFVEDTLLPNLYATQVGQSTEEGPYNFAADGVNIRIGTVRIR